MRLVKLFLLILFFNFTSVSFADHYSSLSKEERVDLINNSIVLISNEVMEKKKKKKDNDHPFNKFINPDKPPEPAPNLEQFGMGTGFFINENTIVTNYHVIANTKQLKVYAYNYPFPIEDVEIVGFSEEIDIAVLRITKDVKHFKPDVLEWGLEKPLPGDEVFALGHGLGQYWSLTKGIISTTYRSGRENTIFVHYYQTDAVINQGNSGGPLFNDTGHVIGVNTLIISPAGYYVGYGYSIPSVLAKRVVDDIIEKGYFNKPMIGVQMSLLEDKDVYHKVKELGYDSVLIVESVDISGAAGQAGLLKDDVILTFDGVSVLSSPDVIEILWKKYPGEEIEMTVLRDNKIKKLTLKVGQANLSPR